MGNHHSFVLLFVLCCLCGLCQFGMCTHRPPPADAVPASAAAGLCNHEQSVKIDPQVTRNNRLLVNLLVNLLVSY